MSRRTILVLAGLLVAQSVIVALAFTPQPHSGGDNAGYISLAHSILDRGAYLEIWDPAEPPHTKYPPVLPLLLAAAMLLGAKSWAALKLIPAFSTVLAVAFTFLWVRGRRGLALGVVVAFLLGLSESVVYYSQWILSDPTFLALTLAALWALEKGSRTKEADSANGLHSGWMGLGVALVVLAYLTRSAGLPLAAAVLAWLGMNKRWKALLGFAGAFGVPAFLWWLRGRTVGGSEYVSEFWLLDPYQPHLGTVGVGGLLERMIENFVAYGSRIIPAGVVGDDFPVVPVLGIALGLVGLVGWARTLRKEGGIAEIFFPLYFALILLWPPAWSGDRFALPLLPLLFFYCGVALEWLLSSIPVRARQVAAGVLCLILILPAGSQWIGMARSAGACRGLARSGQARECLSRAQGEYFALAEWSGEHLPSDAVVTTRKPRLFHVMSGVKTLSIPLLRDPDQFLDQLGAAGSRYISLDVLDGMSGFYVYPVVAERLRRFCGVVGVGAPGEADTQMLGVLDGQRGEAPGTPPPRSLAQCPEHMSLAEPRGREPIEGWEIPLLVWER